MKHTSEPWRYFRNGDGSYTITCLSNLNLTTIPEFTIAIVLCEANAIHIVSCINACKKNKLVCEKCKSTDINTSYHETKYDCAFHSDRMDNEHLHYTCRNCQYSWAEPIQKEIKP